MMMLSLWVVNLNDFFILMSIGLLDVFSALMVWLTIGTVTLAYFSSRSSLVLWGMLAVSCVSVFLTSNLFGFYLMFEFSLLPILIMVLFWGSQPERLSASMYFIMYTVIFSVPFLAIVMKVGFNYFWWPLCFVFSPVTSVVLLLPFLVKLPVFGLHFWLPKAHVEASTSGSMVLASLLLKLGSFGLFRVLQVMTLSTFPLLLFFFSVISSIITAMQVDFKKLVAYSSVTHMTFLSAASMTSNKALLFMMVFMSVSHGWVSSSLFFLVGYSSNMSHSRLGMLLSSISGLHWFYLMFGLILLSNSSIPPMPSFFPEMLAASSILVSLGLMIVWFIPISLLVCYFNSVLFLGVSKAKQYYFKGSMLSISEVTIAFIQVMLSVISIVLSSQF